MSNKINTRKSATILDKIGENECDSFNHFVDLTIHIRKSGDAIADHVTAVFDEWTLPVSYSTVYNTVCAIDRMLTFFDGSRAKLDKAVDAYNASASHPTFKARTLAAKLLPAGPKRKTAKTWKSDKRLAAGVKASIITADQAAQLFALKLS